jgi:hypothetical protein
MDTQTLQANTVVSWLDSADPVLKDTAWWVAGHHPEWGDALATFFDAHLASTRGGAARDDLQQRLVQFGDNAAIQALIAGIVSRASSNEERIRSLGIMTAVARTRLKAWPSAWIPPIEAALASDDNGIATAAVSAARATPLPKDAQSPVHSSLLRIARDTARPIDLRVDAVAALQDPRAALQPGVFEVLKFGLEPGRSIGTRSTAAAVLEKSPLDRSQLLSLTSSLTTAGPLELPRLLRPFAAASDEATGRAMLAALEKSSAKSSVRGDVLRPVLA